MIALYNKQADLAFKMTERLIELKRGCDGCTPEVQLLQDQIYRDKFDQKMSQIANAPDLSAITLTGYFGSKADRSILTVEQIEAGTAFTYLNQADVTIPFNFSALAYGWFAIRSDQPVKNYYIDLGNTANDGNIGTGDDLMSMPTNVSPYDFYITNYPTIQLTSLKLKTI